MPFRNGSVDDGLGGEGFIELKPNTPAERRNYTLARVTSFSMHTAFLVTNLYLEMTKENAKRENYPLLFTHIDLMLNWGTEAFLLIETLRFLRRQNTDDQRIEHISFEAPTVRTTAMTYTALATILFWVMDRSGDLMLAPLAHGLPLLTLLGEKGVFKDDYLPDRGSVWKDFATRRVGVPTLGGVLYLAGEATATFAGITDENGNPLYKALDWQNNLEGAIETAAEAVVVLLMLPLMHALLRSVAKYCFPATPDLSESSGNLSTMYEKTQSKCAKLLAQIGKFSPPWSRSTPVVEASSSYEETATVEYRLG